MSIVLISLSCATDDTQDSPSENPEVFSDDNESNEPDDTEESPDTGELRMIEISYKLDASATEVKHCYLVNDKPATDTLFRSNGELGYVNTYTYTTDGKLEKVQTEDFDPGEEGNINSTEFTYDSQSRIIRRLRVEDSGYINDRIFEYEDNTITVSTNDNFSFIWTINPSGQILDQLSPNSGNFELNFQYDGNNLTEMNSTNNEAFAFNFDIDTEVLGGFNFKTVLADNSINAVIYSGTPFNGAYEALQENYLDNFTYSVLINGEELTSTVAYTYTFDNNGRLKTRIESSDSYSNRELIDYEYFYNN